MLMFYQHNPGVGTSPTAPQTTKESQAFFPFPTELSGPYTSLSSLGWQVLRVGSVLLGVKPVTINWWQFRAPRGADYANEDIRFNGIPRFLVKFNYLPSSPTLCLSLIKLKQTTPSRVFMTGIVLETN